jgi:hypothetical protein
LPPQPVDIAVICTNFAHHPLQEERKGGRPLQLQVEQLRRQVQNQGLTKDPKRAGIFWWLNNMKLVAEWILRLI